MEARGCQWTKNNGNAVHKHFLPSPLIWKNACQVLENLDLPRNGWEEKLLLQCRRQMIVEPKRGQAVLFYNQHPDGRKDLVSFVACPPSSPSPLVLCFVSLV